jgi:hypothetical protein
LIRQFDFAPLQFIQERNIPLIIEGYYSSIMMGDDFQIGPLVRGIPKDPPGHGPSGFIRPVKKIGGNVLGLLFSLIFYWRDPLFLFIAH